MRISWNSDGLLGIIGTCICIGFYLCSCNRRNIFVPFSYRSGKIHCNSLPIFSSADAAGHAADAASHAADEACHAAAAASHAADAASYAADVASHAADASSSSVRARARFEHG